MKTYFIIRTEANTNIRFRLYLDEAPVTAKAFMESLLFTRTFYHARLSGQEIWNDDAPKLHIIQENATVFAEPGEVAISPVGLTRNKTAGFMGVFYGEGKFIDCSNIFARVYDEDAGLLKELGESIWKKGTQDLTFLVE